MYRNLLHFELLLLTALLLGCKGDSELPKGPPRPVTYVTLKTMTPRPTNRLTGSAESWKREEIGFEVPGRVLRVVEPGVDIEGRIYDEEGKLLAEGTVLAELDDQRYAIAKGQAENAATAAQREVDGIPTLLEDAEAALELADKELERWTTLFRQQSASKQQLDIAEAAQKSAKAKVAQVQALRATKEALRDAANASVEQAQVNLDDCKMTSPFTGQIARVHVIPGGYALPGQAVVTVQMMDPMKVDVAVSPETDARVNYNDLVRVYTPNGEQLEGYVYLKDTFADPGTRTFLITLLVRNRRIEIGVPEELKGKEVPRCRNLWKLDKPEVGGTGNYYAEMNAIQEDDDGGHFVWKVEDLTIQQLYEDFDPVMTVRKVPVKLGEGRIPVLQVFTFRELTDIGDLDPSQDVIASKVSGDVQDRGKMVLVRDRWALRPGDVVRVDLKGAETRAGFYVPEDAIQSDGRQNYVTVAKDAEDGAQQVQFVPIEVGETVGRLQRIEAIGDGDLQEGMKVIVAGSHYVTKGESVRTVDEVQATP